MLQSMFLSFVAKKKLGPVLLGVIEHPSIMTCRPGAVLDQYLLMGKGRPRTPSLLAWVETFWLVLVASAGLFMSWSWPELQ